MKTTPASIDKKILLSIDKRYSDTRESYNIADEIIRESDKINYARGIIYGKLLIALTNFIQAKDEHVFKFLMDAYEYFKNSPEEKGFLLTLDTLGGYYDIDGDYEKAMFYLEEGILAAKKSDFKEGEADLLSSLGKVYLRLNNYDKAIRSFSSSLQIRETLNLKQAQASALNLLGRSHALKGLYDEAILFYEKSIAIREKINDMGGIVWSYIGLASIYESKGETGQSVLYYNKALDSNETLNDMRLKFQVAKGLGTIYLQQNHFDRAKEQIIPLVEMAEKNNSKPFLYQANRLLSCYYEKTGDFEKAFKCYQKYTEIKEEVINTTTQNRIAHKQAEFEIITAKKESEIYQLRNVELKQAYEEIEEKNTEITDSIKYAYRIQTALIPDVSTVEKYIEEYFVYYLPKDIVSGDFYWFGEKNEELIMVAADCTGHGVPGALMSMLGVTFLTDIVTNSKTVQPDKILESLRKRIISSLKQRGEEGENKDGMDMSVCVYNPDRHHLQFAGAYNSIYLIRNGELEEIKADRMPVGIHQKAAEPFTLHNIQLQQNDCIYMFSDGFADQFGGEEGKKYKYKRFKEFIVSIHSKPFADQKKMIDDEFTNWRGKNNQIDDVLIIGWRV